MKKLISLLLAAILTTCQPPQPPPDLTGKTCTSYTDARGPYTVCQ